MHTCRRKAGFPTIFEIGCLGGCCQVYLCLKIKFDNLRRRLFHMHLHAYMST